MRTDRESVSSSSGWSHGRDCSVPELPERFMHWKMTFRVLLTAAAVASVAVFARTSSGVEPAETIVSPYKLRTKHRRPPLIRPWQKTGGISLALVDVRLRTVMVETAQKESSAANTASGFRTTNTLRLTRFSTTKLRNAWRSY